MISVANAVEEIVLRTPFLREALKNDLINVSGFARLYKKEIEERTMKKVTVGSIVMAIRRLNSKEGKRLNLKKLFQGSPDIIVRSNLFEITVPNNPELVSKEKKLLELAADMPNMLLTITRGVYETTIIAGKGSMGKIQKLYVDSSVISSVEHISALTIKFPKDILDIPGIIYTILNIIAWNGITLIEVVSTYSEFTLIVKQEDVDRVFTLIQKLFS